MNTIVVWVWSGERSYTMRHAEALAEMLRKTQTDHEYRLVVIADEPSPIDGVEVIRTPPAALEMASVRTPESSNFPSSYRRLWLFSDEAAEVIGGTALQVDIDLVPVASWRHLFELRPEAPFIGWKPGMKWGVREKRVGGGTWRLRLGTHPEVWDDFARDPEAAKAEARTAGYRGSDQAWISHKLAAGCAIFDPGAGIHSIRDYTRDRGHRRGIVIESLPADACMVHFNGPEKPWHASSWSAHPWLADHWPGGRPAS